MGTGLLHDFLGKFSARGENIIFTWRGACETRWNIKMNIPACGRGSMGQMRGGDWGTRVGDRMESRGPEWGQRWVVSMGVGARMGAGDQNGEQGGGPEWGWGVGTRMVGVGGQNRGGGGRVGGQNGVTGEGWRAEGQNGGRSQNGSMG